MTSTEAMGQSPLISVWLKPRRTIETVLNRGSGRGLWLLASLNAMSNFAMALAASGFAKLLLDWRILLGAAAASVVGIARPSSLRGSAACCAVGRHPFSYVGARMERAAGHSWLFYRSHSRPRLVFLGGRSLTATDWTTGVLMLIMALCDLWSVIVFALMLSRVEGFGFWRTFVTYTFGTMLSAAFSAFISIAIRTLLFQPFSIPAASMVPTVLVGIYFRFEIFIWLHPLLDPLCAALVFRTYLRLRARAWRRGGISRTQGRQCRLRQTRSRSAGRPHSGQAGRSLHQRRRRAARAIGGFCRWRFVRERSRRHGEALAGNLAQRRQLGGARLRRHRLL
jgi:hypothetical protein